MYNPVLFTNRADAGQKLGQKLKELNLKNPVILAIPSGGVPVGIEVAKILQCPFDLVIARKIQFPWTTEAGFGAVAEDGSTYLKPASKELSQEIIDVQTKKTRQEVEYRVKKFLKNRKRVNIQNKTVVLVDDGLATGSTMFAAINAVRKKNPAEIIVAIPTSSAEAVNLLKKKTDYIISLYIHLKGLPFAVASSYQKWHDLTEEEVIKLLKRR